MGVPQLKKDAIVYSNPDFKAKCCPCCGKGEMYVIMSFGANAPSSHSVLNSLINNKL